MDTYTVTPLPDGTSLRGSWQVKKNGTRQTPHRKKSAAEAKARKMASKGDRLVLVRKDGTIQEQLTIRKASGY